MSVDSAVSELVVSGPALVIQSSTLEEIGRLQMVSYRLARQPSW